MIKIEIEKSWIWSSPLPWDMNLFLIWNYELKNSVQTELNINNVVRRPFLSKAPSRNVCRRSSIVNPCPEYWRSAVLRNPRSFRWFWVMLRFLLSFYMSSVSSELVTSGNNICRLFLTSQIYVTHLTIRLFPVRRSPVWNKDTRWFSLILLILPLH